MVPKKHFMSQDICYINGNGESKLCTVSAYIKELLSKVEIENINCHICSKWKKPVELVSDKLIMSLDRLHTSRSPRKIITQNVQYWQKKPLFSMSYFRIISRNHCLKMLYI